MHWLQLHSYTHYYTHYTHYYRQNIGRMGKVMFSVCSQGGGVPQGTYPFHQGTYPFHQGTYPPYRSGWGVPQGTYPPPPKVPTSPSRSGWGEGVPQGTCPLPAKVPTPRTAYGVLDTLRSVCLLRSRRRTFLFLKGKWILDSV